MYNPILQPFKNNKIPRVSIVQLGIGGNGGPFAQRFARDIYAFNQNTEYANGSRERTEQVLRNYVIADGDIVEEHNLLRQPFINEDIGRYKAEVIAERYSAAYGINIYAKNEYLESVEELKGMYDDLEKMNRSYDNNFKILIGAVDNNASRKVMNEFFWEQDNILYLDTGIDGVSGDTPEEIMEAGYSGHVVAGLRLKGETILSPVGSVYPEILLDTESRTPTQACGMTVVNHPQRMHTNETAALVLHSYINNFVFDGTIVSHYTNFNAQTMTIRPTYITKEEYAFYQETQNKKENSFLWSSNTTSK